MTDYNFIWKTIDTMFKDNTNFLVKHHLESYNGFFKNGLKTILKDKNPMKFFKEKIQGTDNFKYQFEMYFGGKNVDKIYYGKPVIYDKNDSEADFERRFSFYYDYPGSVQLIGSQRDTALDEIFERITQDVFNASLAKW